MSIFSKALGFLGGGGVGAIAGSAMSGMFNKSSASSANQMTEKMMKNKHQWQADDLQKAGLNRILSMNNGAPMGSSAQASMQDPQLGSTLNQQKQIKQQKSLVQAQTNLTLQQGASAKATAAIDQKKLDWIESHEDEFNAFMNGEMGLGVNFSTAKAAAEKDKVKKAVEAIPKKAEEARENWKKQIDKFKKWSKWDKYFPKK